ncbi:TetR/AcrR family transcriptional regulator [Paracoccus shanxieyensis]|uniref:TetR/AcrR family transcriptional regulator n=1 Tax=Paracoccus shanxieyensis TaxID=2675752 RepID=UPI0012BA1424|nr:TetR/AcrR family transcriptional regulator [Paracoccus shanxieyensis]
MESAVPPVPGHLKPRKTPVQSRSGATVEAIHEAVVQVLLTEGLARLTTTRVAERAGVSVGTLYQYFPNKQALLFTILLQHFVEMAEVIEKVSRDRAPRPLADLADGLADAYFSVKLARPEVTTALYRIAGAIDQVRLPPDVFKRLETAVTQALKHASDATFHDPERAAFTLLSALAGVARAGFSRPVSDPAFLRRLHREGRLLSRAYLRAAADTAADLSATS